MNGTSFDPQIARQYALKSHPDKPGGDAKMFNLLQQCREFKMKEPDYWPDDVPREWMHTPLDLFHKLAKDSDPQHELQLTEEQTELVTSYVNRLVLNPDGQWFATETDLEIANLVLLHVQGKSVVYVPDDAYRDVSMVFPLVNEVDLTQTEDAVVRNTFLRVLASDETFQGIIRLPSNVPCLDEQDATIPPPARVCTLMTTADAKGHVLVRMTDEESETIAWFGRETLDEMMKKHPDKTLVFFSALYTGVLVLKLASLVARLQRLKRRIEEKARRLKARIQNAAEALRMDPDEFDEIMNREDDDSMFEHVVRATMRCPLSNSVPTEAVELRLVPMHAQHTVYEKEWVVAHFTKWIQIMQLRNDPSVRNDEIMMPKTRFHPEQKILVRHLLKPRDDEPRADYCRRLQAHIENNIVPSLCAPLIDIAMKRHV